jgi:HEPN domain-containing protein
MSEPWFEEWVAKAEADYRAAMALDPVDLPDVVCSHCQQCVEKYLKAGLVSRGAASTCAVRPQGIRSRR